MELVARNSKWAMALVLLALLSFATPLFAQEQVVEYGRIVQADDGTGSLDYLIGYDNSQEAAVQKKPWLPVLSPLMICLDCWITKAVDIHQFYSQQAADEYFAMAENCADVPLSMDPNILKNTGLKYTVLAPIYAWRPSLLNRRGILGGAGSYGVPSPIPSVAAGGMGIPASAPANPMPGQAPAAMPDHQPMKGELQPMPAASGSSKMEHSTTQAQQHVASSGKWSEMSDAEILAHFGLDPGIAKRAKQVAQMDGSKLEQPVTETNDWQFADEAPTVKVEPREMVALNHDSYPPKMEPLELPQPTEVEESVPSVVRSKTVSEKPTIELDFQDASDSVLPEKKPFSSTDAEYDRMREIEKDLLGY